MFSTKGGFEWTHLYGAGAPYISLITDQTSNSANIQSCTSDANGDYGFFSGYANSFQPTIVRLNKIGFTSATQQLDNIGQGRIILVDNNGNVYQGGLFSNVGNDAFLIKYNSGLAIQWQKGLQSNSIGTNSEAWSSGAIESGGANIYVGGTYNNSVGQTTAVFAQYEASSGNLQFQKFISNAINTFQIAVDSSNNFFTVMNENSTGGNDGFRLEKWNSSGTQQWGYRITNAGGDITTGGDIVPDSSGNVFFAYNESLGNVSDINYFSKFSSTGAIWSYSIGNLGTNGSFSQTGVATDGSNAYVLGTHSRLVSGNYYNGLQLMKIDTSGNIVWQHLVTNTSNTSATWGPQDINYNNGNLYIGGAYQGGSNLQMFTMKTFANGSITGTFGNWNISNGTISFTSYSPSTSTVSDESTTGTLLEFTPTFTTSLVTLTNNTTIL